MVGHDLRDDFILLFELGFEALDFGLVFGSLGTGPPAGKSSGSVLKEGFLPLVEEGWMDLMLVAQIGDRGVFEEMFAQDGDFLFWRVMTASFHGGGPFDAPLHSRSSALFQFRLKHYTATLADVKRETARRDYIREASGKLTRRDVLGREWNIVQLAMIGARK